MGLVEDRDLGVLCAASPQVCEFVEHYKIFHFLKCTYGARTVGYLAIHQVMTVDWSAPWCVTWSLYLWDTVVVHLLKEYCAT